MAYLLNLIYLLVLAAVWPWLLFKALTTGKYRAGWGAKFLGLAPRRDGDRPCVWLHAVSVGEVNLLAPLLAELRRRRPDWDYVISTTTQTGFTLATKKYAGTPVFYAPLDFSWAVRRAIRRVRPTWLLLAELELWPNFVRAAADCGARVAIVNGRLSDHSLRGYRRIHWFTRGMFRRMAFIAAQNDQYAARFRELGAPPDRVHVTGSVKFDGAQSDRRNPGTRRLAELAEIAADDVVFLAGSTQAPEEELAIAAYRRLAPRHPRLRLILVPRHPERFDEVAALLDKSGLPWRRRSQLGANDDQSGAPPPRVLLVDAVGELGLWWGIARIAFVGGSLGQRGGQNMIEPAAYGAAVSFGPNTRNFRDVVALLLDGSAAVVVHDGEELTAFVERALTESQFADALGQRAQRLVATQLGATRRTIDLLDTFSAVPGATGESPRSPSSAAA